ncbi:MAG: PDZ domain-containing protein [Bacteroidia bacterium]
MNKIIFLSLVAVLFLMKKSSFGQDLPRSASFGALVRDLNDSSGIALKLSGLSGTHIEKVVAGSSAQRAGFTANDVLISMDGEQIKNTNHFLELLKKHHGGDKVKIGYYRKSKLKETTMILLPKQIETSDDYDIIYSSLLSGSNHLRTIITRPKGGSIYPAVLIVGGVGCYSIDNPSITEILSIKMWSDSLTRNGFVTIRIEKTGMGDSKGIPCNECDFNTEKQAFLDGLKQLKSLSYVDKENIFIAGFSIGGVIAPLIAQQEPVKGIIVYGTVGRNWLEYELDNSLRQQLLEDLPADSIDRYMRAEYIRLYGLFVEKKAPEQIIKEHPETKSHLYIYPMRIEYFQQVADVNIRELWMNTKAKVLAMHGSSDFVSSATEHKLIAEIVNHYNPGNATYVEIANSDHWGLFAESDMASYSHQQTELNFLPLTNSIKWLKDIL